MRTTEKGNVTVVMKLIDLGSDINLQANNGWTALMYACKYKHKNIVEFLLKNGAYSDLRNTRNESCWDLTASPCILKYKKRFNI